MALGIKWTLSFKSIDNVDCHVDILKEGFTGAVIQLVGADNPVEWQEDDDSDLLKFVRIKTGYIRVVEDTFGQLNALYPANDTDHFVRVYRGSNLLFSGYMQATAINQQFVSAPRVLEFAIQSPLAVAKDTYFNTHHLDETLTAADIIKEACTKLSPDYTSVIFPRSDASTSPSLRPWDTRFNAVNICPYKDKECYFPENAETPTETISALDFIESVCSTFGWHLHDLPHALMFVRHDFVESYDTLNLDTLRVTWSGRNGDETYNFNQDASNNESEYEHLRPMRKVTVCTPEWLNSVLIPTKNLIAGQKYWYLADFDYQKFSQSEEVTTTDTDKGLFYMYKDKRKATSAVQKSWILGTGELIWKPTRLPHSSYLLFKIDAARGKMFEPNPALPFSILISVKLNDSLIKQITAQFEDGKLVPQAVEPLQGFGNVADSNGLLYRFNDGRSGLDFKGRLSISISKGTGFENDDCLFIRNFEIKDPGYQSFVDVDDPEFIQENKHGLGEEKVDVPFPSYRSSENYQSGWEQKNLYGVTTAHDVVKLSTREARNNLNFVDYAVRFNFWKDTKWKVLSLSYNLRMNEMRTTLISI